MKISRYIKNNIMKGIENAVNTGLTYEQVLCITGDGDIFFAYQTQESVDKFKEFKCPIGTKKVARVTVFPEQ